MNEIRRKLQILQWHSSGRDFVVPLLATAPLSFAAVGLIAGILLQSTISGGRLYHGQVTGWLWFWGIVTTVCAVAILGIFLKNRGQIRPGSAACASIVCFVAVGALRLISFCHLRTNDICKLVGERPRLATIRGTILTQPRTSTKTHWYFAKFQPVDPSSRFYLKVAQLQSPTGWAAVRGTVYMWVDEPVMDLSAGDQIEAFCWLKRIKPATNPGQFDTARYLAHQNIFVAASVKTRQGIKTLGHTGLLAKIRATAQRWASEALLADPSIEKRHEGLLEALLLGYRGDIEPQLYRAFRKTGLLHLISLSGMHLGIIMAAIWWFCKVLQIPRRPRAAVVAVAIGLFILVVPPRAPTLRAAIIAWSFCAAQMARRRQNPLNSLCLAALVLLLVRPTYLFERGWQLSFSAVGGILIFWERIYYWLSELPLVYFDWFFSPTGRLAHVAVAITDRLLKVLSVSAAAWLSSAGVILYHFHTITPLVIVWTLLALPIVAGILVIGLFKGLTFLLLPSLSSLLAGLLGWLSKLPTWVVQVMAQVNINISELLIGRVHPAVIASYYAIGAAAILVPARMWPWRKILYTLALVVVTGALGVTSWRAETRESLTLTCLDVGHGQAIVAELPKGRNILFDGGSLHLNNVGRRVIGPYLDYAGIDRLDAVIISHEDIDHINGLAEAIEDKAVAAVYANETFRTGQSHAARFLVDWLAQKAIAVGPIPEQFEGYPQVKIQRIWPVNSMPSDIELTDNDRSAVLLLEYAGRKILLCSDIEKTAQQLLLQAWPNLVADIIVAPHHGSTRTRRVGFLKALQPQLVLCSGQAEAPEGFRPEFGVYQRCWLSTAEHGAIQIRISKDGTLRVKTYRKRSDQSKKGPSYARLHYEGPAVVRR